MIGIRATDAVLAPAAANPIGCAPGGPTMKLLLAALLGALTMFVWEFVAHMFTPLGEAGMGYLPSADAVSSSLASAIGDKAGMYMFPTGGVTKESTREEKMKAMEQMNEE